MLIETYENSYVSVDKSAVPDAKRVRLLAVIMLIPHLWRKCAIGPRAASEIWPHRRCGVLLLNTRPLRRHSLREFKDGRCGALSRRCTNRVRRKRPVYQNVRLPTGMRASLKSSRKKIANMRRVDWGALCRNVFSVGGASRSNWKSPRETVWSVMVRCKQSHVSLASERVPAVRCPGSFCSNQAGP
jgi:hypothetical protein